MGNLYIADTQNHRIRKVDTFGTVTTIAGTGIAGNLPIAWSAVPIPPAVAPPLTEPAGTAQFNMPTGIVLDNVGNIYVADSFNHCIRKITPAGVVSTLAGKGPTKPGYADLTGNLAKFNLPSDLAIDALGNIYVADTWNHMIRKVTPAGIVTTVAGEITAALTAGTAGFIDGPAIAVAPAISAKFNSPGGVALDTIGNIFVADTWNHRIRKIDTFGNVSTVAGAPPGPNPSGGYSGAFSNGQALTQAQFNGPQRLVVDPYGNIFISDTFNGLIRRIDAISGVTETVGGSIPGYADGWGNSSQLQHPLGITTGKSGKVYVADAFNHRIREIDLSDIGNNAPVASAPSILTSPTQVATSIIQAADPDPNATLSYTVTTLPLTGTATVDVYGLVTYTPNSASFFGPIDTDSIEVTVSDQFNASSVVYIPVTISNTSPNPTAPNISTASGVTGTTQIMGNDTDTPNVNLSYIITTPPKNGTATVNTSGLASYTSNRNLSGADYFVVTVTDPFGASGTVSVQVSVVAPTSLGCVMGNKGKFDPTLILLVMLSLFFMMKSWLRARLEKHYPKP